MIPVSDPVTLPLRDIHLPDSVSWWPLAPGWWVVLLLLISLITALIYFINRKRNYRRSAIYLARQELEKIKDDYQVNPDKLLLAQNLSSLLRRISISVFERKETASLIGNKWLNFLDRYSRQQEFSNGVGKVLIDAPYQSNAEFDDEELILLVSNWIDQLELQGGDK